MPLRLITGCGPGQLTDFSQRLQSDFRPGPERLLAPDQARLALSGGLLASVRPRQVGTTPLPFTLPHDFDELSSNLVYGA